MLLRTLLVCAAVTWPGIAAAQDAAAPVRPPADTFDLTRAIALDGVCLREKCEKDHDLGYELMSRFALIFAQRLEATRLQLMDIYGNSTKNK